jgi:hypothetical protein
MAVKLAGEHIKRGSKTWRSHGIRPGWAQGHLSPTLGYETKGGGALTYAIVRSAQWYTSNADVTIDEMVCLGAITTNMKD